MLHTFEELLRDASSNNITLQKRTVASLSWLRAQVNRYPINSSQLIRQAAQDEATDLVNSSQTALGKCYMAFYDPKHKLTLPYFDRFPILFPFWRYPDGFLSLNLHFLNLPARARLMDVLYSLENNAKIPENKRLRMNYGILKAASRVPYFQPCVRRYLWSHFRSRFMLVPYQAWSIAAFLPVQSFSKKPAAYVYSQSAKIYNASR